MPQRELTFELDNGEVDKEIIFDVPIGPVAPSKEEVAVPKLQQYQNDSHGWMPNSL